MKLAEVAGRIGGALTVAPLYLFREGGRHLLDSFGETAHSSEVEPSIADKLRLIRCGERLCWLTPGCFEKVCKQREVDGVCAELPVQVVLTTAQDAPAVYIDETLFMTASLAAVVYGVE